MDLGTALQSCSCSVKLNLARVSLMFRKEHSSSETKDMLEVLQMGGNKWLDL